MAKPWVDEVTEKIFCPVNRWDCPHYNADDGSCALKNVEDNCDDFYAFWEDEIEAWYSDICEKESAGLW